MASDGGKCEVVKVKNPHTPFVGRVSRSIPIQWCGFVPSLPAGVAGETAELLGRMITRVGNQSFKAWRKLQHASGVTRPLRIGPRDGEIFGAAVTKSMVQRGQARTVAMITNGRPGAFVLQGGPGVGKTESMKKMCQKAKRAGNTDVVFVALAAMAASLLPEGWIGRKVRAPVTLARLKVQEEMILGDAKESSNLHMFIVCDEMSMVDCEAEKILMALASALGAVGKRVRLVLIGDVNQLPPPGGHGVFAETKVVADPSTQFATLSHNFRCTDPRLSKLICAIRDRNWADACPLLQMIKLRPPVVPGEGGYQKFIAPTNAQVDRHNELGAKRMVKAGARVREWRTKDGQSMEFIEGAPYRFKQNKWNSELREYEYTNGMEATVFFGSRDPQRAVEMLARDSVLICETAGGDILHVTPIMEGKRPTFRGVLCLNFAQTAHNAQGCTRRSETDCDGKELYPTVLCLNGVPDIRMLYVMFSRFTSLALFSVQGLDVNEIRALFEHCPCGCDGGRLRNCRFNLPPPKCNKRRLAAITDLQERFDNCACLVELACDCPSRGAGGEAKRKRPRGEEAAPGSGR